MTIISYILPRNIFTFRPYISDNDMTKMSFKQFYAVEAKRYPRCCGGYTAPRPVTPDDLAVWANVLVLHDTDAEFAAKGIPTLVQTAVVSGVKFRFIFKDGSTVTVWRSWRKNIKNRLQIVSINGEYQKHKHFF